MPTINNTAVWGQSPTGPANPIGSTAGTAASQTLTTSGNAVAGETFSVGGRTYTWVAAIDSTNNQTPNLVLVGANAAASVDNAVAVLNGSSGQGTTYSYNTAPNFIVSGARSTNDLVVTARVAGADGNSIPVAETMTNASWGGTTLAGGVSGSLNVAATISTTGGVARTITSVEATSGGTVTAGAKSVSFLAYDDYSGDVNGADLPASSSISYNVPSPSDTLPAIVYTVSAGTLRVDSIT